ncbi:mechanosensitive ion channel [Thiomicrospira sp. R3]|uniref:mechanosensitive ion channel family protein n=1 Tax=Thiomicrospira sp. R3 TaxID=3035472 RepID=UPI00259B444E|nr:mechanosensitive ion channel domain-containing protein [Thiomicrospira sp. R3]WFE67901.1 mechanosensitive ion channel [Thiomicrospira sp. R3]
MFNVYLLQVLEAIGLEEAGQEFAALFLTLLSVLILIALGFYLSRQLLLPMLSRLIDHLDGDTLSATHEERPRLASHIAHLVPAILLINFVEFFFSSWQSWEIWTNKITWLYLYVFIGLTFTSLIDLITAILALKFSNSNLPYRVISQLVKLITFIVVGILSVSLLVGSSPAFLLSGLGALTAVLLLVFRDTLLGLVASVQVAANRMVAKGDWIEMPKYGANGNVIEVALTTVKVRNWDNTVTTFPTYALISDSFINWRAMQESGGRRIKRSIQLDIHTVRFVDEEELTKFKNNPFLARFFEEQNYVDLDQVDLTNSAVFRAYIEWTLRQHPLINQDLMVMARQLQPTELGLPIEVYCFSADKAWVNYEKIQSDIFDRLLAVLPLFDLMAFQRLGGKGQSIT